MAACAANLGKHPQVPVQRPIVARSLESLHLTGPTSASGHKTSQSERRTESNVAVRSSTILPGSAAATGMLLSRSLDLNYHCNSSPSRAAVLGEGPVQSRTASTLMPLSFPCSRFACCTSSMPLSSSPTTTGEEAASVYHALISSRCTRVVFASHTRASSLYLSLATAQHGFFVPWPWACASSSATLT